MIPFTQFDHDDNPVPERLVLLCRMSNGLPFTSTIIPKNAHLEFGCEKRVQLISNLRNLGQRRHDAIFLCSDHRMVTSTVYWYGSDIYAWNPDFVAWCMGTAHAELLYDFGAELVQRLRNASLTQQHSLIKLLELACTEDNRDWVPSSPFGASQLFFQLLLDPDLYTRGYSLFSRITGVVDDQRTLIAEPQRFYHLQCA